METTQVKHLSVFLVRAKDGGLSNVTIDAKSNENMDFYRDTDQYDGYFLLNGERYRYEGVTMKEELTEQEKSDFVRFLDKIDAIYREGFPVMQDAEFDMLVGYLKTMGVDYISPYARKVTDENRKQSTPRPMGSAVKIGNYEELEDWIKKNDLLAEELVIEPKYDGIALLVSERPEGDRYPAWTAGKDNDSNFVPDHYSNMDRGKVGDNRIFTKGEAIMKISTFEEKYADQYANPRNFVGGKMNAHNPPPEILADITYIRYTVADPEGTKEFFNKREQLDLCNNMNSHAIPYVVYTGKELLHRVKHNPTLLDNYFHLWSENFECDGLIIEVNDRHKRFELGYETNSYNPKYCRAYKGDNWEDSDNTEVIDIVRQPSKRGYLKPMIKIKPIKLNGATIRSINGDNEGFLIKYGIGVGSKLTVKRSGMVIPRISVANGVPVLSPKEEKEYSKGLPDGDYFAYLRRLSYFTDKYKFDDPNYTMMGNDGTDRKLVRYENPEMVIADMESDEDVQMQQVVAFFEILGADGISDGIIQQFFDHGYKTVKDITNLTYYQIVEQDWEGWGKRKAENIVTSIQECMKNVPLEQIQHASGVFTGLGSTKLALVKHFKSKPTIEEVKRIEGFADISAEIYVNGYDKFWEFVAELPVTIKQEVVQQKVSAKLDGNSYVFTGFRDKEMENRIKMHGGEIKSSVSAKVTHLICKNPQAGSSKLKKAYDMGINVVGKDQMNEYLDSLDGGDSGESLF